MTERKVGAQLARSVKEIVRQDRLPVIYANGNGKRRDSGEMSLHDAYNGMRHEEQPLFQPDSSYRLLSGDTMHFITRPAASAHTNLSIDNLTAELHKLS